MAVGLCSVPEGDAVFVVKLQDYTATEKDEVTLDCELSKDVPVIWYHSEKEITASKMVIMRSEGTRRSLILKKVEQSDKGKYVCDCGTDKTTANINIEGKRDAASEISETESEFSFFLFCINIKHERQSLLPKLPHFIQELF